MTKYTDIYGLGVSVNDIEDQAKLELAQEGFKEAVEAKKHKLRQKRNRPF